MRTYYLVLQALCYKPNHVETIAGKSLFFFNLSKYCF